MQFLMSRFTNAFWMSTVGSYQMAHFQLFVIHCYAIVKISKRSKSSQVIEPSDKGAV